MNPETGTNRSVEISAGGVMLRGDLTVPAAAAGVILFAHGSGSSRLSPRNQFVAQRLQGGGFATLLFDLFTQKEEDTDAESRALRFNVELLAERVVTGIDWIVRQKETRGLLIGLFGASTGAAGALIAAARRPHVVGAVVSRGGRPDLAGRHLAAVASPCLLIVAERDREVTEMNRRTLTELQCHKDMRIIAGATHLFEEEGSLEQVAHLALEWFEEFLE